MRYLVLMFAFIGPFIHASAAITKEECHMDDTVPPKKIIIVGTSWVIAKYLDQAITSLGFKPVFLVNIDFYSTEIAEIIKQSEWYHVDINSYETVERFLEEHRDQIGEIGAITSLADSKLVTARKLADKFNVAGPDKGVLELSDKNLVCQMIAEYSPKTISFFMNQIPLQDIHQMIDQHGAVVIKPTKGSGALGTFALTEKLTPSDIRARIADAGIENADAFEWLAQAQITGTLYSLEGYCIEGTPTFLGFTRRSRVDFSEMVCHFPSDHDALIQKTSSMIYEGIHALISRSQFKNGYFHCEFLVTETGAYLIDANFGRIGGGAIIEQLAHSFKTTPDHIARHVLDIGLFGGKYSPRDVYQSNPRPSWCLLYGMSEAGRVRKVHAVSNPFHTVIPKTDALVPAIGTNFYAVVGMIAGDPEQVLEEVKSTRIETEKGEVPAFYFVD
jgi:hypothetical protein